ncbi:MAG TPA: 2-C-methyl-D-erythritol 4-phosphate cytidylyltransferase [Candidatus Binataceae bacterium]|nr:2-C-methyl-D-erythritol 4-phosphate cytidylyltransferase [Candidatus Binataceae bacterium]
MKTSAIIVADGSGLRLGLETPKAFAEIGGMTLVARALRTLASVEAVGEAVVTAPQGMESAMRSQAAISGLQVPIKIVPGGAERQDSVRIALELVSAEAEIVVVHDAARPFASRAMFAACIDAAARSGGAIVAVPLADTLKRVEDGVISATIARTGLWQAQTPQAFRRGLLVEAHERAMSERIQATDDADLVERLGATVEVVQGSQLNLKITTPDDLRIAIALAPELSSR